MNDADEKYLQDGSATNGHADDEAHEIVRAIKGGEVDAIVVEEQGEHQLMALARLTDLDEITELVRALRNGEVDAFVTDEGEGRVYAVTPIHEVLSQQYHLTRAITDNATTALFIMDAQQQCVFMNPAAEQLTGFTFDEVRSRGGALHDLVHHTRRDGTPYPLSECPIDQAFPSKHQMRGEEVFIHKDGHFFDVAFAASPILDSSGEAAGTVIEVRDVTQRKAIEKELREADRRKDQFIATLAHELRNPLAPVSNLISLIKSSGDDPAFVRRSLATIERQVSKMVRLVDDLLDVSRITRNTIELRRETLDLAGIVFDAREACRPTIEAHGHRLDIDLPPEPVYVDADPARLSQVLCNLINNACKFTPPRGHIQVSAERTNGEVLVKVKDNGVGIPREELSHVFEMFSQLHSPGASGLDGLGIGLALTKQLVELHGGTVDAQSAGDGAGSEFTVRIPAVDAPVRPEPEDAAAHVTPPSDNRILVVDDNLDSAESMTILLSRNGNDCRTAHSGPAALEAAEAFRPRVILLDIGLPGMDGYEVCRELRRKPWARDVKIIAMTGWGQVEDMRRSEAAGFTAHLVKPVDLAKLYALINDGLPKEA
jgi:PAS domain S-box-containing protein